VRWWPFGRRKVEQQKSLEQERPGSQRAPDSTVSPPAPSIEFSQTTEHQPQVEPQNTQASLPAEVGDHSTSGETLDLPPEARELARRLLEHPEVLPNEIAQALGPLLERDTD
jgi:hypothetical protein